MSPAGTPSAGKALRNAPVRAEYMPSEPLVNLVAVFCQLRHWVPNAEATSAPIRIELETTAMPECHRPACSLRTGE
ncbi:hypothetical protein niasHT_006302 [Heterodera trifolii]|uniref:Uncharacterized protein n=1 Tax=Heterodera trifolii TaxID=157864 RepID=A0ABD2LRK2_9BILA